MKKSISVAALLIAVVLPLTPVRAGMVYKTYDIKDYFDIQNGHHLSGTITTNGSVGTLTQADIISWTWSTQYSEGDSGSPGVVTGSIFATDEYLSIPESGYLKLDPPQAMPYIEWDRANSIYRAHYHSDLWYSTSPSALVDGGWKIAEVVPEPTSAALIVSVALALAGVTIVRRRFRGI